MKNSNIKQIFLAVPRGFCAGVERAVDILDKVLKKHGSPVYVRHAIVHNKHVVKKFEKKGAVFVESLQQIPDGSVVVFSAHGSPPVFYDIAKKKNLKVYDAICPLVLKVHLEAKRYANEGFFIFYIGHHGHPEPEGVIGNVAKKSIALINNEKEAEEIVPPQTKRLIVLTQTTLSFDDTKKIIKKLKNKYPNLTLPSVFDICYATQNRQIAVKELAKKVQIIFVIGSKQSSNSVRLKETAKKHGVLSYLIDDVADIKNEWLNGVKKVGITAGASAPEDLVLRTVKYLRGKNVRVQKTITVKENIHFPISNDFLN